MVTAAVQEIEQFKARIDEFGEDEREALEWVLHAEIAKTFNATGFKSFFNLFTGIPLHEEGMKWADNVFTALAGSRKLLQEAFRGSGKTTVFSKYFFCYYMGHHPERTNLVVRINTAKARETGRDIARLIERDRRWKLVFPHVVPDKDSGWGAETGYFLMRDDMEDGEWDEHCAKSQRPTGPTFIGYGLDSGSVIGTRVNGCLIVDDIHDKENSRSDRQMKEVKSTITQVLKPILVRKKALEIWNFTPWRTNDAYAVRKATGLYLLSQSPALVEAREGDEGATYWPPHERVPISGRWYKLAWPQEFDYEVMTELYIDVGPISFAQMYQLDLEATKGVNLKAEWLHEYPAEEIKASWPVFFGVDYASTRDKLKNKERDYFALSVFRAIPHGGVILVGGTRARISKGEALATVMSFWGMYPTLSKIGVESIGKGEEFYNDLLLMNDDYGRIPPLFEIPTHGRASKGERFENWMAPRFAAARVWISDTPTEFLDDFKNEWLLWPDSEYDDCLDAAYMGLLAAEGFLPSKEKRDSQKKKQEANPWGSLAYV